MAKNKSKHPQVTGSPSHKDVKGAAGKPIKHPDYLWSMSQAPAIDQDTHWFQILIVTFFTAMIMTIVRMASYEADMTQFYWSSDTTKFIDLFSLVKSQLIFVTAILCILVFLYHLLFQMFYIKKSYAYIPMLAYVLFVLLSYIFSDYQEFALWGWRDRFEGTVVLISYMVVLFYTINAVNTEKNVKWILYPVAFISSILGLIGMSQYFRHDFFQTVIGGRLITPPSYWDNLDKLRFNFEEGQIYQTVFNPNYVSFYLTLLMPLFAMLFIQEHRSGRKVIWAVVYGLLLFNMFGSASSGGFLGLGVSFIIALILLNKRLIDWKFSILALLAISIVIGGLTFSRYLPEVTGAVKGVLNITEEAAVSVESNDSTNAGTSTSSDGESVSSPLVIDYFETYEDHITASINGNTLNIYPILNGNTMSLRLTDGHDAIMTTNKGSDANVLNLSDPNFERCKVAIDKDNEYSYVILLTDDTIWPFAVTDDGIYFRNSVGKLVSLEKIPVWGFEKNLKFGTYRGYIWSRSLPMIKKTMIIGNGADTYCAYFPQNDYAGRYSIQWRRNIIVDKPHSLYIATAINTGLLSLLALITLYAYYVISSIRLYWKRRFTSFLDFAGAGILIGVCGFLAAATVNDSSVSVMPLFYGLLGTGIAVNMILRRQQKSKS